MPRVPASVTVAVSISKRQAVPCLREDCMKRLKGCVFESRAAHVCTWTVSHAVGCLSPSPDHGMLLSTQL